MQWIEKAYDEVENNRPPTHALCYTRYAIVEKLSNKQSTKVICRFNRLRTAHSKRQTSHISTAKFLATHTFDYIVLKVNHGLTSCEGLTTALDNSLDIILVPVTLAVLYCIHVTGIINLYFYRIAMHRVIV